MHYTGLLFYAGSSAFDVTGIDEQADSLIFIRMYKQKPGYCLSKNFSAKWQKNFYDHVIRKEENLLSIAEYILNNPVRKGLVKYWDDYPFKGSVGLNLEELLQSMA